MRCDQCGWVVVRGRCPCGAALGRKEPVLVPVGNRVVIRPGRGPSMKVWLPGEVKAHQGAVHKVTTPQGDFWCEGDDLLPESAQRVVELLPRTRVWALWVDGRWYPGSIDGCQGSLRHVTWDDGDSMWLESTHLVPLAAQAETPEIGMTVMAPRWDGEYAPAEVEQEEGQRFRVVFRDGEEAWVSEEDLRTVPPNPFAT